MSVTKVDGGIRTDKGTFLPFIKVKGGKDYLQVMHRLVWFREENPEGSINTESVELNDKFAIMRATVSVGGKLLSTGYKREDLGSFGDYMEKAETGAIGRALAASGYGTQFAPELDEGERIVDSPVSTVNYRGVTVGTVSAGNPASITVTTNGISGTAAATAITLNGTDRLVIPLNDVNTPTALNKTNAAKKGFKRVGEAAVAATTAAASADEDYT